MVSVEPLRTCAHCGGTLRHRRAGAKFCSGCCRTRASRHRKATGGRPNPLGLVNPSAEPVEAVTNVTARHSVDDRGTA